MSENTCPFVKRGVEVWIAAKCQVEDRFCPYKYYAKSYTECPYFVREQQKLKTKA